MFFNKAKVAKEFDIMENNGSLRGVVYARNASFEIARRLGLKYFMQLDDDYRQFQYRFDGELAYNYKAMENMDRVLEHMLDFFESSGCNSIALAQGGDYIGGDQSANAECIQLKRKCMNSFICSVDRPFKFLGRINEDVNAYVDGGSRGELYFTTNQVSLVQTTTQTNAGGLTELYLDSGTYVKSFYTVMLQPSSAKVKILQAKNVRLHHSINWNNAVPMIIREEHKKVD
jgi:hypothetical protein